MSTYGATLPTEPEPLVPVVVGDADGLAEAEALADALAEADGLALAVEPVPPVSEKSSA